VPDARIVALGIDEEPDTVVGCAEAGIAGYAPRDCTVEQLVATLTSVERGELPCSPRVAAVLFRRLAARNRSRDASGDGAGAVSHVVPPATATPRAPVRPAASEARRLTAREQEILALIDHGLSNKQIAEELRITAATVKNHVHSILEKLDVCRRGQAAALVRARLTGVPVRPAERHERDGVSTLDPCPFGRRLDRTAYGGPPTG
jgi:DNA-binding NarL/FixJ family response regulator